MILQACLNGARRPDEHMALPLSAKALAVDAHGAVHAGANELHLHVRDAAGKETLDSVAVGINLHAVRTAVPGTLIGISTGAWIEGDQEQTLKCIASWRGLPDYASVNFCERAAPFLADMLRKRGVGVEAGLASVADAERLLALGIGPLAMRILIELDDETTFAAAKTTTDRILEVLAKAPWRKPLLLHGFNATVWPVLEHAIRLGFSVRVGLEDGLKMPDGSIAKNNADLVAAAAQIMRSIRKA